MTHSLFVQTLERALRYSISDIGTLRRIARLSAQQGQLVLNFTAQVNDSFCNPTHTTLKRMFPGTVHWASSRFEMPGLPRVLRKLPAPARASFFQLWLAGAYFAFKMGVC
jgi:hypothetical protein